jgi:MFS transporter, DHA2 family, multidrug resistance protein
MIACNKSRLYPWLVLGIVTILTMAGAANATTVGINDPVIQGYLSISSTAVIWFSIAYLLALATGVPLAAHLTITLGRKKTLIIAATIFFTFSTLSGCTTSYYGLLIPRFLSGVGAGIFFPICVSILPSYFPKKRLTLALAFYSGLGFGLGIACGDLFGGYIAQNFNWRWIFFANIPAGILTLSLIWLFLEQTETKKLPRFDFLGYFLFILTAASLLVLVYNVKQPWNTEGWHSTFTIGTAILALLFLIAFIIRENIAKNPLFIMRHFRVMSFLLGCVGIFMIGTFLFGNISSYTTILHDLLGYDKMTTGIHLFYYGIFIGIGAFLCGLLSHYINDRILCFIALILLVVSSFANHSLTYMADHTQIIILFLIRGLGVGFGLGPILALGIMRIKPEEAPKAIIFLVILRQLGGAFGNGIIELIRAERAPFHLDRFGTFLNTHTTKLHQILERITTHLMQNSGLTRETAENIAQLTITENVAIQANIAAYDDAFFILGIVVSLVLLVFIIRIGYVRIQSFIQQKEGK